MAINIYDVTERRPISCPGVSPGFMACCHLRVIITEKSLFYWSSTQLLVRGCNKQNTVYSLVNGRSKCSAYWSPLLGNSIAFTCSVFKNELCLPYFYRPWMFFLCTVAIFFECSVALDPPNLNRTENKAHILPPCQACKALVGSFKKVTQFCYFSSD